MKKMLTNLLALLGLATACGQQGYENAEVNAFAERIKCQVSADFCHFLALLLLPY